MISPVVTAPPNATATSEIDIGIEGCGDDIIQAGEQCDDGENNVNSCGPSCEQTCTYCSLSCQISTQTGSSCPPPPTDNSGGGSSGGSYYIPPTVVPELIENTTEEEVPENITIVEPEPIEPVEPTEPKPIEPEPIVGPKTEPININTAFIPYLLAGTLTLIHLLKTPQVPIPTDDKKEETTGPIYVNGKSLLQNLKEIKTNIQNENGGLTECIKEYRNQIKAR